MVKDVNQKQHIPLYQWTTMVYPGQVVVSPKRALELWSFVMLSTQGWDDILRTSNFLRHMTPSVTNRDHAGQ